MASKNEWVAGSAVYVRPRAAGETDAWTEEAARQGGQGKQELTFAGEAPAPHSVASALRLKSGEPAAVRRRIIRLDNTPVELADTYYPPSIARGTALVEARKIKGGAVTLLASLGHTAARVIEDVAARLATEGEREQLQLGEREPVMVIERLTFDDHGAPIQFDVMVAPASMRRLRYEMKVN